MRILAIGMAIAAMTYILQTQAADESDTPHHPDQAGAVQAVQQGYVPGMGEIMGATQMRHAKLWLAGDAKNWALAAYELDEIREGLDDAVKYYPIFKEQVPVAAMLDKLTREPLTDLDSAIKARNAGAFAQSFDRLTSACNACHQAAGKGFIVITRPETSTFSNQRFATHAQ